MSVLTRVITALAESKGSKADDLTGNHKNQLKRSLNKRTEHINRKAWRKENHQETMLILIESFEIIIFLISKYLAEINLSEFRIKFRNTTG